jgi:hypothetical protein
MKRSQIAGLLVSTRHTEDDGKQRKGILEKHTAIHRVDGGERDVQAPIGLSVPYAVQTKPDSRQDRHGVLPAVDKVREHISRVMVTPDALQCTPYRGQRAKEAEEARVRRIATFRVIPAGCVQAEEELDVLQNVSHRNQSN